jgi:hypothetical protein
MDNKPLDDALDAIAVAPPEPESEQQDPDHKTTHVREARDAEHHRDLARDPSHEEGKLDVGLDESFPSSDPPAVTQPGHGDPAPSSGYDEEEEKARKGDR